MRPAVLILLLLIFLRLHSQEPQRLRELLNQKNYISFSNFTDTVASKKSFYFSVNDDNSKPLFDNVSARVVRFREIIDYNGLGNVNSYSVNLLAKDNQIVYYNLTTNSYKQEGERVYPVTMIDSFKNENAFNEILSDYRFIYKSALDEKDLWATDMVYGWGCGITGDMPEPARKATEFTKKKQIDSIRSWLRSPDPVKQLYAVEAFNILGRVYLTKQDKQIIMLMARKKVSVPVCDGCIYSAKPLDEILHEINKKDQTSSYTILIIAAILMGLILLLLILRRRTT